MSKLQGKVAVITGGTSGMALATAKLFVDEGAHVFVTGRHKGKLDDAVAEIGRNVTGVQGDAGNLDDLDRLAETVREEKGRVDVLFASAGYTGALGQPLDAVTEQSFDESFGVNVRGTLFTAQKLLPLMREGSSIILNGSASVVKGSPGTSVYSAGKAALRSFARIWAAELAGRGIRVNVLQPGAIDTPTLRADLPADMQERIAASTPAGRLGRPTDIATAALFLASSDAGFVTGGELFVDGGLAQV
ncbi:SDR family oxidoreductase [Streptomyces tuirus]|uniref:SDR family oxidoreductase n=1 Tax=Streptomyces tuirus TaxID=68278 RepID=A0A941F857_9ACTN|nr:SDR family oxidoreductase [Streptomyces tuirus]